MDEECLAFEFESDSLRSTNDQSEAHEPLAGDAFLNHMSCNSLEKPAVGLEFATETDPVTLNSDTDTDGLFLASQPLSPLLDFNYDFEARRKSSISSTFEEGDSQSLASLFEPPAEPARPCLSEQVAAAVQSKRISEACWSSLGPRGQAMTIAWLCIEISKGQEKLLKLQHSDADLLQFANELLDQRTQKRTDLYKRTFYKSFIQHLLGKYTLYKHTKAYKIKAYTEVVAAKFFSSCDEHEQKELRSIFENTKHFSVPNLKRLFSASAEFQAEFDRYMRVDLQQETEATVQEFSQRLSLQLSYEQVDVTRAALSVVEKRTLAPWTAFDVSAAQVIYFSMTQKSSK